MMPSASLRERKRRSNPASYRLTKLDCFAEPVIGRRFAPFDRDEANER
jgi:hypothetical protein